MNLLLTSITRSALKRELNRKLIDMLHFTDSLNFANVKKVDFESFKKSR